MLGRLLSLGLLATIGLLGCGPASVTSSQPTQATVNSGSYQVQQYEGGTGTEICGARYRNCLVTLVPSLGDAALGVCAQRRATCINALGEGFFYRGGTRTYR